MKFQRARPAESASLCALAGALLLGGPVWHYLYVNHYPFSRAEAFVLPLAAALSGALILLVGRALGRVAETLAFSGLLYVYQDLQFDLDTHVRAILLAGTCFLLAWLFRSRRAILTCLMLGAFYLASLPRHADVLRFERTVPVTTQPRPAPLLVHIILDEQWGIGGLRAAGDSATAQFLEDFYLQRGFEVYPAAYSRSFLTRQSIPELLSLGKPVNLDDSSPFQSVLRTNPYFEHLQDLGYATHVYESSYMDFCHAKRAAPVSCEQVPSVSIANVGYLKAGWRLRATLATHFMLEMTSHVFSRLHPESTVSRRSFAGRALTELDDARNRIAARPPAGTAIFIHLLFPHRPIEVGADCSGSAAGSRFFYEMPDSVSDAKWRRLEGLYAAQVRCVHRRLARVIAAIDSTAGRDGAIVIVHGDHGSRLSRIRTAGVSLSSLDRQQLNAQFSTLLAVRRPGVAAAVHINPVPVQQFLWKLASQNFTGDSDGQWPFYVRAGLIEADRTSTDTIRALAPGEMLWIAAARP